MNIRNVIEENKILAIMRNIPFEKTLAYAEAVVAGGIRFFEVALNSENPYQQIKLLRKHFGDEIYLGAGTATTVEKAKKALAAGAQFLLSPSTDVPVLRYCRDQGISIIPGVLTPSDVSLCLSYDFQVLKLFPAGVMPPDYIKSLKGPLNEADYLAIGGVNAENAVSFFEAGYIGIGMGSNMMPADVLTTGDWRKGSKYISDLVERLKESK